LKKKRPKKQQPKRLKFAQSGHPGLEAICFEREKWLNDVCGDEERILRLRVDNFFSSFEQISRIKVFVRFAPRSDNYRTNFEHISQLSNKVH
jgi:hypothetical protein